MGILLMNVLIVLAHPEEGSFSGALAEVAGQTLESEGHHVEMSDLYHMGWNPVLGHGEFEQDRLNAEYLDLSREQEHAFLNGSHTDDVRREQAKVAVADLVIFHFPLWWFSMPAIMKGWIDRVLSRGFAYSKGRKYSAGHFQGKRAMLCLTTGTASTLYEPNGIDGDLEHILWPIHNGVLAYTGFTVLPPFSVWMPARASDNSRQGFLNDYEDRLRHLDEDVPLFFHPLSDYDATERLKPEVKARSRVQWNPRAGQSKFNTIDVTTRRRPSDEQ